MSPSEQDAMRAFCLAATNLYTSIRFEECARIPDDMHQFMCMGDQLDAVTRKAHSAEEHALRPPPSANPTDTTTTTTDLLIGPTTSGRVHFQLIGAHRALIVDLDWAKRLRDRLDDCIRIAEANASAQGIATPQQSQPTK